MIIKAYTFISKGERLQIRMSTVSTKTFNRVRCGFEKLWSVALQPFVAIHPCWKCCTILIAVGACSSIPVVDGFGDYQLVSEYRPEGVGTGGTGDTGSRFG